MVRSVCTNCSYMKKTAQSRNILLTGAAGFIGSNVLAYLFEKYPKYHFIVLDALTYCGDIRNISEKIHKSRNFRFVYGDVRNQRIVEHLVSQVDTVIHFAAETHVTRSIHDDTLFFETDILGTQRIASAVLNNRKKIRRFVHISTSEVYGTAVSKEMSETHPLNPQSPYAAAKAGADRLVYSYIATHKLPAVIVRPFNMYGPQQHLEKVIPRFITSCILGEPLTVHGTGNSSRDFTYVFDLARALDLVIHAPDHKVSGEVFNVGVSQSYSTKGIADMVIKSMKSWKGGGIVYSSYALNIGDRPGQVFRHTADTRKIQRALGWKPTIRLVEGLQKTIEWYINNQAWWEGKRWMRHVSIETEEGKRELH